MSFSAEPRPANASPKPTRFWSIDLRVLASKAWKMSSNWTGTVVWVMGSVPPSLIIWREVPMCRSTYFRPSTDSGRIDAVESAGTLP